MATSKLSKVLAAPSKIASALDWRKINGSVLSLNIHQDRIGLAIASHPSLGDQASSFQDIPLAKKGRVTEDCKQQLASIVKDYRVCGVVVSWPVQTDTGRIGAACGRVLHTLEGLLDESDLCTPSRPLCLWDGVRASTETEDEWGRSKAYTQIPINDKGDVKAEHHASVEQYHQDENMVAAAVWDDFCKVHWPELYQTPSTTKTANSVSSKGNGSHQSLNNYNVSSIENGSWNEASAYVNAALL